MIYKGASPTVYLQNQMLKVKSVQMSAKGTSYLWSLAIHLEVWWQLAHALEMPFAHSESTFKENAYVRQLEPI